MQQVLHGHLYSSTLTVHACIHLFHRGARARAGFRVDGVTPVMTWAAAAVVWPSRRPQVHQSQEQVESNCHNP